jgi:hypothetical protein
VQGLLEQRDGAVETLELGEEEESIGALGAHVALLEELAHDRARARPLACGVMRMARSERSTVPIFTPIRRRQPEGAVGELGRESGRAALGRDLRGIVEHGGNGSVGRLAREREVTGAF